MGDPVTMAAVAVGGSLLSARATLQAGKAQQNAANFNALVSERNAMKAEQEGEQIRLKSEQDILAFSRNFNRLQASTQQSFRYNGFVATSGTPLRVALENAQQADEEIAARRYNAEVAQLQASESALEQRMAADLERMTGAAAAKAARTQAMGTLLQGAASGYRTYKTA